MKSLHGILHGILWNRLHGLPKFSSCPPLAWCKFRETNKINFKTNCKVYSKTCSSTYTHHWVIILNYSVWDILYWPISSSLFPPTKFAMVLQHDPFSPHTILEGPWQHKTAFPTPMVWPLDENQGSSPLQGHGSWLMCEVALACLSLSLDFPPPSFPTKNFHTSFRATFLAYWKTLANNLVLSLSSCGLDSQLLLLCFYQALQTIIRRHFSSHVSGIKLCVWVDNETMQR
jgi:hypothetical protein